jgi:hypothetical protein
LGQQQFKDKDGARQMTSKEERRHKYNDGSVTHEEDSTTTWGRWLHEEGHDEREEMVLKYAVYLVVYQ